MATLNIKLPLFAGHMANDAVQMLTSHRLGQRQSRLDHVPRVDYRIERIIIASQTDLADPKYTHSTRVKGLVLFRSPGNSTARVSLVMDFLGRDNKLEKIEIEDGDVTISDSDWKYLIELEVGEAGWIASKNLSGSGDERSVDLYAPAYPERPDDGAEYILILAKSGNSVIPTKYKVDEGNEAGLTFDSEGKRLRED